VPDVRRAEHARLGVDVEDLAEGLEALHHLPSDDRVLLPILR
jgi:hypothetical protein